MKDVNYNPKRLRIAALATAIIFVIMVIFSVVQWNIASDGGNILIRRVTFIGEGGSEQSGLMFIPKGASAANPAPAIVNYHGRNNSSYNLINWAIEEARRGYIVLNPDIAGTMETSLGGDNSLPNLALSPIRYLNSLDMVSEITATGHSMANLSLQVIEQLDTTFKPKLKGIIGVGGAFFYFVTGNEFSDRTNHYVIEAEADLYEKIVLGGVPQARALVAEKAGLGESMQDDVVYGSFEDGTAFSYSEVAGMSHHGLLYDKQTIKLMLDFTNKCSPAPNPIDSSDMVFWGFVFSSAVAFIAFLFFIISLAYTITSLPGVYALVNVPLAPSQGKSATGWVKQLIADLVIPFAIFVPVTSWTKKFPTNFWTSLWVNQVFFWLVAGALIGVLLLIVRLYKKSRTEKITALDFGFGTAEEKILDWKRIAVAVGITLAVVTICYTWINFVITSSGLNYQLFSMFGQIVRMFPERIEHILRYMLLMIPVYFMVGVNAATTRRLKDTGNETRDTIRAILINIFLAAGVLTALVAIQFISIRILGDGSSFFPQKYWDSISYGWSFPAMMATAAGGTAFLHRKTGNIWVGMLVSWVMVISMTILQACLVPVANVA